MKINLKKHGDYLVPLDDCDRDIFRGIKNSDLIQVHISKPRNIKLHRRFFAALNLAFEAFEPIAEFKGRPVQKSFERFRKDVIILAGYYDIVANVKGEVRYEAKSISFSSMNQEDFDSLYNDVVNVLLREVLKNYTRSDFDKVIQELIRF